MVGPADYVRSTWVPKRVYNTGMNTISELYRASGPIQGVKGPIEGMLKRKRSLCRWAEHRQFEVGTPVEVFKPSGVLYDAGNLIIEHDGGVFVKHLCSEDGEVLADFVTGHGRHSKLKKNTEFKLSAVESNTIHTLDRGSRVLVYRQAGGKMWAISEDEAWYTWFTEGEDAFEKFVKVNPDDLARLDDMLEHAWIGKAAPLNMGSTWLDPTPTKRRRKSP